jgi:hypothetical protein
MVTRWRLASRIYFCFWRWWFLMCRARSFSWSLAEMPMTSPSSMVSSPSGGAKPRGGACGVPSELHVRTVPSGLGWSWRCLLLLTASSSKASWGGGVREGLAFRIRQKRCVRRVVDGRGSLRISSLGGHRGLFFVARTMGAKCWEPACLGKLIQRGSGKCVCKV